MDITVDLLNELLNRHAVNVLKKSRLKINHEGFVFHLEENLRNDLVMTAGNPVVIRMNLAIFSKVLLEALKDKRGISKQLRDLNSQLLNCYEVGNRYMLHSLSLVPVTDVLARDLEFKKWKKAIQDKAVLLLSDGEISYGVNIQVTAVHIPTGKRVSLNKTIHSRDTRDQIETKLRVQAKHDLTILVRQPQEDTSSQQKEEE